jgi:hypothetical protein
MTSSRQGSVATLIALTLTASACLSGPERVPEERALLSTKRVVDAGVQRAIASSEAVPKIRARVRFNPVACDVPEFEIYTHERWRRVYLDSGREIQPRLEGFRNRSSQSQGLEFLDVEGAYQGTRRAQSGARYPVFAVVEVL